MDHRIGFSTVTEKQRIAVVQRLHRLEKEYRACFQSALDLIVGVGDRDLLASILIMIGNAAGLRATSSRTFGPQETHEQDVALTKRALLEAKDIYASVNDHLGVAHALFNLANQIRFVGEENEALRLAERALPVAKKYDDAYLVTRIKQLTSQIHASGTT